MDLEFCPSSEKAIFTPHSNILLDRIKFKEQSIDKDDMLKKLQSKYILLKPSNIGPNNVNCNGNKESADTKLKNGVIKAMGYNSSNSSNGHQDGVVSPQLSICNPDQVLLQWKQIHKIGAGLVNLGNTCFLNSVLQCLTYCPPLANYLLYNGDDHASKCAVVHFCMTCELQKHMKRCKLNAGSSFKPLFICQKLRFIAKHFQFGRQEDAHEFLRYVIECMWKSSLTNFQHKNQNAELDPLVKQTTIINRIFGGFHRSQVTCLKCHEKSNTFDHFMEFILDIKNIMDLNKALEKWIKPELLEKDNAYKCLNCKSMVSAQKQFTIHRAPNVATFHLKRFDFNRIMGGKITKHIAYPEKLNLRPFMSDPQGEEINYKLNAVLVHLGATCNSGHYFCYVKSSNNLWYQMDDSRVSQASLHQVLNQQAYILFYVRETALTNHLKSCTSISLPSQYPVQTKVIKAPITESEFKQPLPPHKSSLINMSKRTYDEINGNEKLIDMSKLSKKERKALKKSKKRKRSPSNNSSVSDDIEWVEKTKETVEEKRYFNDRKPEEYNNNKSWNNSRFFDHKRQMDTDNTIAQLREMGIRGFGSHVTDWKGGSNSLKFTIDKEKLASRNDYYNEEFDRGKIKKQKIYNHHQNRYHRDGYSNSIKNPFQSFGYKNNQNKYFKSNRGFRGWNSNNGRYGSRHHDNGNRYR